MLREENAAMSEWLHRSSGSGRAEAATAGIKQVHWMHPSTPGGYARDSDALFSQLCHKAHGELSGHAPALHALLSRNSSQYSPERCAEHMLRQLTSLLQIGSNSSPSGAD